MCNRRTNSDWPQIGPLSPTRAAAALQMVFGRLEAPEREQCVAEALARLGRKNAGAQPALLLGAWRSRRLVGAVLVQPQPGRTALLQMARVVPGESSRTAVLLLLDACERLARQGLRLVQVLLETDDLAGNEPVLEQAGFTRLAELFYLVCLKADFPQELPAGPICFESSIAARAFCPDCPGYLSAHPRLPGAGRRARDR